MRRPGLVLWTAVGGLLLAPAALRLAGVPAADRAARADDALPRPATPAERGYLDLTTRSYQPAAFDRDQFDHLYEVWPEPARARAAAATPAERRRLAFARYGFSPRPGDTCEGPPLQYVEDARGGWSMSCFACHGGQVEGRSIPGLPNAHIALQDLFEDVAALRAKREGRAPLGDVFWRQIPLGESHGTTNAVMFSVALLTFRDADLNLSLPKSPPRFVHHDLDAPPWWNVRKRSRLYIDGFAPKGHRSLMQFLLVPANGPARLKEWEPDFVDVLAYIESLTPPPWPHEVDRPLAEKGRVAFEKTCARCHGTYGRAPTYPEVTVPIDEIGTDRLRHDAVPPEDRARFAASWFTKYDPTGVVTAPAGYVAPPLDGVWASAPYLHNGSVPTLWHVLHPAARPHAWRVKSPEGYDRERVGLDVEARDAPPAGIVDGWERRDWFDTSRPGKSAAGHSFPEALSEEERRAVLEYLKTL